MTNMYSVGIVLFLSATLVQADTVNVGALSYDTFIPAGGGSPGVYAFDLANLTGAYGLPPDFPVSDPFTFGSAVLTLTLRDLSQDVIDLGDIGPGFLLDGNGNPIVQVPGSDVFDSAEFTATLSPLAFALSDGTEFAAALGSIDVLLLPSIGTTLTVDVDQTTVSVPGAVVTTAPEPGSCDLILTGLLGLGLGLQRRRGSIKKVRGRI